MNIEQIKKDFLPTTKNKSFEEIKQKIDNIKLSILNEFLQKELKLAFKNHPKLATLAETLVITKYNSSQAIEFSECHFELSHQEATLFFSWIRYKDQGTNSADCDFWLTADENERKKWSTDFFLQEYTAWDGEAIELKNWVGIAEKLNVTDISAHIFANFIGNICTIPNKIDPTKSVLTQDYLLPWKEIDRSSTLAELKKNLEEK